MASFNEHITQAERNLNFLSQINSSITDCWDWQVTVCFYSALHLVNAHVASKAGENYLTHNQVNKVINPFNEFSVAKFDQDTFLSYNKLLQLSRRSRYLLNENFQKSKHTDILPVCLTYDKHFRKAIHHLDKIITYMNINYRINFKKLAISCIELQGKTLENFEII